MYYDHYLASLWPAYSKDSLTVFSERIYATIEKYWDILPEQSQFMFPYMKSGNWLVRYQTIDGIDQSLNGMSRRLNNNSKLDQAAIHLQEYYKDFTLEFKEFIKEVKIHFE